MNEDKPDDFQTIISISEQMLEHARQERWDDVTICERERKKLLAEFFSKPLNVRKANLSAGIRIILEKDREIVRLGAAKRDKLRKALQKFNQRKDALEAYSAAG
ncbi:MAG: flagellar protein FliT [Methylococcaceae bacterium]|nr:flagellar protein FliT [Methylococcaceae bacterium]MCI0733314.1 flagellar protein FliT [Methylococcaceae bacterium]